MEEANNFNERWVTRETDKGWNIPGHAGWRRGLGEGTAFLFPPVNDEPQFGAFWYAGFGSLEKDSDVWVYEIVFERIL
jgi:hypothetical protein